MTSAAPPRLGPVDRAFHRRVGARPPLTGFFLDFEGAPPDPGELTARILGRAAGFPALNLLLPEPGGSRWRRPAGELEAGAHIRNRTELAVPSSPADPAAPGDPSSPTNPSSPTDPGGLGDPADPGGLGRLTDALLRHPLPGAGAPPWDVWLLTAPGRFRIAYRVHHAQQDGVGAAHSALGLLADTGCAGPRPWRALRPTAAGLAHLGRDLARSLRTARGWYEPAAGPSAVPEPVLSHTEVPDESLRGSADRWGTSVNDIALAALALAFRSWRAERDGAAPGHALPALVPMSTRQDHERDAPGNRLVSHRVLLPCGTDDLGTAALRVHRQTRAARDNRRRDAARAALAYGPSRAGVWSTRLVAAPRTVPVNASSITLPSAPECFGVPLTGASMFFAPPPGLLAYVSFTRLPGTVRCTVVHDVRVPGLRELPRHWRTAVTGEPPGHGDPVE
ncbi:hypothetical protein ACWF94_40110 [Streptomyces sp. NPDC055078]